MSELNTKDEQLLDFAVKIAEAANYLLQVDNGKLRVVNRIQTGTEKKTVRKPTLISLEISPAYPIKRVYSEYEYNVPYPISNILATERKNVGVDHLNYGEELDFESLSQYESEVLAFLRNILTSEKAPVGNATLFGIHDDIVIGDRILCIDDKKLVECNITVFSIVYDFNNETTSISGASDIAFVRNTTTTGPVGPGSIQVASLIPKPVGDGSGVTPGSTIGASKAANWPLQIDPYNSISPDAGYARFLVVGGGGSGGISAGFSGGGGGGGVISGILELVPKLYSINIGDSDQLSFLDYITAPAGGQGGSSNYDGVSVNAESGGSGGGGSILNLSGFSGTRASNAVTYSSYGSDGGVAASISGSYSFANGAGGGGAGGVGSNTTTTNEGGDGGVGVYSNITGTTTVYAGGGGGSSAYPGTSLVGSGTDGGGDGGSPDTVAASGQSNTGGGGGGRGSFGDIGRGGSGIVVLRMKTSDYSGETTGSPTVVVSGDETILIWKHIGSGSYLHTES